jgi:23S rRNA (adenine2503-C2)-methyltransferase
MQSHNTDKAYILDHSRSELITFIQSLGLETYRARQLFHGIYVQLLPDVNKLTTLSKQVRSRLDAAITLRSLKLIEKKISLFDQTTKFLWQLSDGSNIESVIIYEGKRVTFCISSQVGCALDCKFCATGKMGFLRNLTCGEIVEQVIGEIVEQVIQMKQMAKALPTNIVFMGMGEPLLNPNNVLKACDTISDAEGLAFSRKKVTISTSGITRGIVKLADMNSPYSLAISLNAAIESKRQEIMPIAIQNPLKNLKQSIRYYISKTRRRVTFEYILIAGKNDGIEDAKGLLKFTAGIPCKINLIPCNSEDTEFAPSSAEQVHWFNEYLNQNHRTATIRQRKGWEIQAACGQLYAKYQWKSGVKIAFRDKKL